VHWQRPLRPADRAVRNERFQSAEQLKLSCKRPPERSDEGRLSAPILSYTALALCAAESDGEDSHLPM
jgi:hypothetical protein